VPTRIWSNETRTWNDRAFNRKLVFQEHRPSLAAIMRFGTRAGGETFAFHWSLLLKPRSHSQLFRDDLWSAEPALSVSELAGVYIFRDIDGDGTTELISGGETYSLIQSWSVAAGNWVKCAFALPKHCSLTDRNFSGLRF